MPNQRGCAARALGHHPVRSVAGGMGRNQAQTRGVPARIQPIACFDTAGAAPSPVVEGEGTMHQLESQR